MKSNVTILSPDRELFGTKIRQQTKTGFLNLSDLQEAYTRARVLNAWSNKGNVQDILTQKQNSERVYYLLQGLKMINSGFTEFMQNIENEGLLKYLKKIGVYKTTGARHNRTVWCNPYIWTLIAMELNPALYAKVVLWLNDKLILNRIEAGNFYKDLSRAVTKFNDVDYIRLAKALNYKIFGQHEHGIRNLATKEQLEQMYKLEWYIAKAVDMGHLKTFDDCINEIDKYNK